MQVPLRAGVMATDDEAVPKPVENDMHVRWGVAHGAQTTTVDGVKICDICGRAA